MLPVPTQHPTIYQYTFIIIYIFGHGIGYTNIYTYKQHTYYYYYYQNPTIPIITTTTTLPTTLTTTPNVQFSISRLRFDDDDLSAECVYFLTDFR